MKHDKSNIVYRFETGFLSLVYLNAVYIVKVQLKKIYTPNIIPYLEYNFPISSALYVEEWKTFDKLSKDDLDIQHTRLEE